MKTIRGRQRDRRIGGREAQSREAIEKVRIGFIGGEPQR